MTNVTNAGRALALKLAPAYADRAWPDGSSPWQVAALCSLIARHAKTYQRLQECQCNGHPSPHASAADHADYLAWVDKREARVGARLLTLVNGLPPTAAGKITVHLGGDPRGHTVKLVMPGDLARLHDDFGREGVCV